MVFLNVISERTSRVDQDWVYLLAGCCVVLISSGHSEEMTMMIVFKMHRG